MGTWGKAAAMAATGITAHIIGIDINPVVLEKATEPYPMSGEALAARLDRASSWPAGCRDYFESEGGFTRPVEELRGRVTFREQDLLAEPLEPGAYDAVVINNVLSYYPKPQQSDLIGNAAQGLKPGGIFTASDAHMVLPEVYETNGLESINVPCPDPICGFYQQP
jgi:chemotaxis methyl-accepting protein methylase